MSFLSMQNQHRVRVLCAYGTREEAEAQEYKERVLDALEECRWSVDTHQQIHTILDILEHLVRKEQ